MKTLESILKNLFLLFITAFLVTHISCTKEQPDTLNSINREFDNYYYSIRDTVFLKLVPEKYVVEFVHGVDESHLHSLNIGFEKLKEQYYLLSCDAYTLYTITGYAAHINPVYETVEHGALRVMYNEIILKFKEGVDPYTRENMIHYYNLLQIKSTDSYSKYRTLNPLQTSKAVFESGLVKYCHPVFKGNPPTPFPN